MRTGDLRRRITIQNKSVAIDTFGGQTVTWVDYMTSVPCSIEVLTGQELLRAQAIYAEISHKFVVRYSALLADPLKVAAMRIIYINAGVTRYFNISAAMIEDEYNKQIEIMAAEGLNLG